MDTSRSEVLMGTSESANRTDHDVLGDEGARQNTFDESVEEETPRNEAYWRAHGGFARDPEAFPHGHPSPHASFAIVDAAAEVSPTQDVTAEIVQDPQAANNGSMDADISQCVTVYVKHAYSITLVQLVLALICAVFAIPFIDLSTPDAGLRLRYHPVADQADGFLAAAQQMRPDGFSAGVVGAAVPPQSKMRIRTAETDPLQLIWYTDPGEDIFSQHNLEYMFEFERQIYESETYRSKLCVLRNDGTCMEFRSPAWFLMGPDANKSLPLANRIRKLFAAQPFFFAFDYVTGGYVNKLTRTVIPIGTPLDGYDSSSDQSSEQSNEIVRILEMEIMPKVVTKSFWNGPNPRLTYHNRPSMAKQARDVLARDLTLAGVAIGLIFICLLLHFRSFFLSCGAILQILISFPVTLFVYRVIFGIKLFGGLHVLGVFLILGIGVDDCFVFFDSFDQVTREHPTRSVYFRMDKAYRSARYAMFATSFTTALCFLSLMTSGIPILVYFGVFTCLLVCINFVLVMTLFAGLLLIWDAHLRFSGPVGTNPTVEPPKDVDQSSFASIGRRMRKSSSISTFDNAVKRFNSTQFERMFVFLGENVVVRNVGKGFIILASFVLIAVLASYGAQIQPSESIDSFWPAGHPFRRFEEYWAEGFYGESENRATMRFMNGLKAPFRINYDYTDDLNMGEPVYDENFDLSDPKSQQFLADHCEKISSRLGVDQKLASFRNESLCPMNEFRDWLRARGRAFPVMDRTVFHYSILEFVYQPYQTAVGALGFRRSTEDARDEPRFVANFVFSQFPTTRSQRADDLQERFTTMQAWNQFTPRGNTSLVVPASLGKDASSAPIDGFYEVWMETQQILVTSSFTSIAFSLGVAYAVLLLATMGDIYSACVGVLCLGGSVACTLGVMYLSGWSLGAVEAVSCSILCGVAVDYSIHMSIAHSETYLDLRHSRSLRVVDAMRRLGASVLLGALTTFLASSVLLMCTIAVLVKFGQFMVMVISFAIVFAIFFQMALLSLPVNLGVPLFRRELPAWVPTLPKKKHCSDTICYGIYMAILVMLCIAALSLGMTIPKPTPHVNPNSFFASTGTSPKPLMVRNLSDQSLSQLAVDAWTEIALPVTEFTGCALSSEPYSFFVYRAPPSFGTTNQKLLQVEFEGRASGLCFSKESCDEGGFPTRIDRDRFRRINAQKGTFPFTLTSQKPLLHVVFPYCTADAFLGNVTRVYDGEFLTMKHVGANNVKLGMDWLTKLLAKNRPSLLSPENDTSVVFQGCGVGAFGALATLNWAAKDLTERLNLDKFGLISDSATKTVRQGSLDFMAFQAYGSMYSLNYAAANETTQGRMLVASSAYDWFQTRLGQFDNTNATLYRLRLEQDASVYPFVLRVNGDRHCVALNPVEDRLETDPHVQRALEHILQDAPRPSNQDMYYKCGPQTEPPCELDADLRDKEALCRALPYAWWCVK